MNKDELNSIYEKIKSLKNAGNLPLTKTHPIESRVKLMVDENVAPALFKPSQVDPSIYYANSLTIAAVKKEIFSVGDGFQDLEDFQECIDCVRKIDAQFWSFCPYCEGKLSK